MTQREKLLAKAIENPGNLRFSELCQLARQFGFKQAKKTGGSHRIYKREGYRRHLNFQDFNGKAKAYQVRDLLDAIRELDLIDEE